MSFCCDVMSGQSVFFPYKMYEYTCCMLYMFLGSHITEICMSTSTKFLEYGKKLQEFYTSYSRNFFSFPSRSVLAVVCTRKSVLCTRNPSQNSPFVKMFHSRVIGLRPFVVIVGRRPRQTKWTVKWM